MYRPLHPYLAFHSPCRCCFCACYLSIQPALVYNEPGCREPPLPSLSSPATATASMTAAYPAGLLIHAHIVDLLLLLQSLIPMNESYIVQLIPIFVSTCLRSTTPVLTCLLACLLVACVGSKLLGERLLCDAFESCERSLLFQCCQCRAHIRNLLARWFRILNEHQPASLSIINHLTVVAQGVEHWVPRRIIAWAIGHLDHRVDQSTQRCSDDVACLSTMTPCTRAAAAAVVMVMASVVSLHQGRASHAILPHVHDGVALA